MRNALLSFLLIVLPSFLLSGQSYRIEGVVTDAESGKSLPFVHLSIGDSKQGTVSDINGRFVLELAGGEQVLTLSYIGYQRRQVQISAAQKFYEIALAPASTELEEVQVVPGVNPAHRIIKNAVAARKRNQPESLPAFSYRSYNRLWATVDTSQLGPLIDTLPAIDTVATPRLDSSDYFLKQFIEGQHIFFMESLVERNFIKGKRDNQQVLAVRTSGFKNPLFALLNTQLQSFSFYSDYISIMGEQYLNPLTPGSTKRYYFLLEDTVYNSAEDTVFIISFRPRPNYGFAPMKGQLHINSSQWAIQNALAQPVEEDGLQIGIEQQYTLLDGHWFPQKLHANISIATIAINGQPMEVKARNYLQEINLQPELRARDLSLAAVSIDPLASDNADEKLRTYRQDSLGAVERRTYQFMDSLSSAEGLERRLNLVLALVRSKLPIGIIDLDLPRLVNVNREEGWRLGVGAHTNEKFSRRWTLGGYWAYGRRDQTAKYGWDVEWQVDKPGRVTLLGGYQFDIFESSAHSFLLREYEGLFDNNYHRFFIPKYDEVIRHFAGVKYRPVPAWQVMLMAERENRLTRGDYFFLPPGAEQRWQNGFNFFELTASVRYAPGEKVVEGDFGRFALNESYPLFYGQFSQGLAGVLEGDFSYQQIDLMVEHQLEMVRLGSLRMQIRGAWVSQALPFGKLYGAMGHQLDDPRYWRRSLMIADPYSFETMRFNEFLSSRYLQLTLRHNLQSRLFRRENFAPQLELVGRALWGNMDEAERHRNLDFKVPRLGYYEAGLELNRLLDLDFVGLGIAAFYRIGPYQLPDLGQNLVLRLTSRFSF